MVAVRDTRWCVVFLDSRWTYSTYTILIEDECRYSLSKVLAGGLPENTRQVGKQPSFSSTVRLQLLSVHLTMDYTHNAHRITAPLPFCSLDPLLGSDCNYTQYCTNSHSSSSSGQVERVRSHRVMQWK